MTTSQTRGETETVANKIDKPARSYKNKRLKSFVGRKLLDAVMYRGGPLPPPFPPSIVLGGVIRRRIDGDEARSQRTIYRLLDSF